jgi:hypothetical protein
MSTTPPTSRIPVVSQSNKATPLQWTDVILAGGAIAALIGIATALSVSGLADRVERNEGRTLFAACALAVISSLAFSLRFRRTAAFFFTFAAAMVVLSFALTASSPTRPSLTVSFDKANGTLTVTPASAGLSDESTLGTTVLDASKSGPGNAAGDFTGTLLASQTTGAGADGGAGAAFSVQLADDVTTVLVAVGNHGIPRSCGGKDVACLTWTRPKAA